MRHLLLLLAACHSDVVHTTHAFVAPESCGQGPYDVHLTAEGKMGSEGVEVWACTPRRIAGHVEMLVNGAPMRNVPFGEGADNGRCVGGGPVVMTSGGGASASTSGGAPGMRAAQPVLVAQAFDDKGALIPDDACKAYGLEGDYLMNDTMTPLAPGADIDVRIWSDAPNDLSGVIFLVRHAISTKTRAEEEKEWAKLESEPAPPPTHAEKKPDHGAPPAPLAEERPGAPSASARWVPGYWTWLAPKSDPSTGATWGWVAGFWRDDGIAMPAPRIEVPGAAPEGAVWIGGAWQLRAGGWFWVAGRWRGR